MLKVVAAKYFAGNGNQTDRLVHTGTQSIFASVPVSIGESTYGQERAKTELNLKEGEFTMFVLDQIDGLPQSTPVVMLAQSNQAQMLNDGAERVLGVCNAVEVSVADLANGTITLANHNASQENKAHQ